MRVPPLTCCTRPVRVTTHYNIVSSTWNYHPALRSALSQCVYGLLQLLISLRSTPISARYSLRESRLISFTSEFTLDVSSSLRLRLSQTPMYSVSVLPVPKSGVFHRIRNNLLNLTRLSTHMLICN